MPPILRRQRNSAGMPTIRMTVDEPGYSLNAERTPWLSRRLLPIISISLIGVAAAALFYAWWLIQTAPTAAPLALPAPTLPSVASVASVAAPLPSVAAAPSVAAPLPSVAAAPSVAAPVIQAAVPSQPGAVTCPAISGMPVFAGATCIENDQEQDDGITKLDNTYVTAATTDEVRRFFERAFADNRWTIAKAAQDVEDGSWEYTVAQGTRRIKLNIDPERGPNGAFTQINIAEK